MDIAKSENVSHLWVCIDARNVGVASLRVGAWGVSILDGISINQLQKVSTLSCIHISFDEVNYSLPRIKA